jgi:hypothetical protein
VGVAIALLAGSHLDVLDASVGWPMFTGQVLSDLQPRQEGVRVKHRLNTNSVKLYDKAFTPYGSVLRTETTIHNTDDFLVYRPKEGGPETDLASRVLRSGIADLHRRAITQGCGAVP